jgi:signal transduction histidine kinase
MPDHESRLTPKILQNHEDPKANDEPQRLIAELQNQREELRQRVEEVEKMLAVAPVGIWVSRDAHCNVILGNRTANRYYEAADQENVSANISTRRKFFRNGRELKPEELPMQSAVAGNIDIRNAEFDIRLPSGKWRSLLGFASPLHNAQGNVRGCIGAFLDITERKAAEQQLARENREIVLVNRILQVFAEADGDALFNRVLEIVQEGLASKHGVFGYIAEPGHLICPSLSRMLDACEVSGKCIHYPPDKWKGLWARALREKRAFHTNEPSPVPAGHPAISNNLAAPILFHGEAVGLLNLANKASDFTETDRMLLEAMAERIAPLLYAWIQKKLREDESAKAKAALRRMNETLEHQVAERTALAEARAKQLQSLAVELIEAEERERRQFAHLLHDDLQQMLAAAKMQLQAVSVSFPNTPALTVVDRILNESIAKTRHLSHELSPPVLQHFGLVAALQWLGQRMGEQFGLAVELETHAEQLLEVATLKNFLFRAVHELLFNVVKHAGVKSARIVLTGSDTDLSVVVSDRGQGFNPDILNNAIKESGFGLMGIRERASYIGGSLTIDSAPGQGSRFTLTVPFTVSSDNATTQRFPAVNPECRTLPEAVVPASGGIRVLFADDHHVMRQGLIKLVQGQPGIHVVGQAANGQEALDQARRLGPDVVVMDVSMPLMDGVEATRRIKAELPQVRVIGLTMYEEEHIARIMREAGAEDCISKSVSPAELLKAIYGNICNN